MGLACLWRWSGAVGALHGEALAGRALAMRLRRSGSAAVCLGAGTRAVTGCSRYRCRGDGAVGLLAGRNPNLRRTAGSIFRAND